MKIVKNILFIILITKTCYAYDFNADKFKDQLALIVKDSEFENTTLGIYIYNISKDKEYLALNADEPFIPASIIKIPLTLAILSKYDKNATFKNSVFYVGHIENHTLFGDIYLKGSGAPNITLDSLKKAALGIKLQGIDLITGKIYYDDFIFKIESPRFAPAARDRYAPPSGLTLNSNRINLNIVQRIPQLVLEKVPDTNYAVIHNSLEYQDNDEPLMPDMAFKFKNNTEHYFLKGTITKWTEKINYVNVGVSKPGLYFATVFKEFMEKAGVDIKGKIKRKKCPIKAKELIEIESPSNWDILSEMNANSNNVIAENLLRILGGDMYGYPASRKKGAKALQNLVFTIIASKDFLCDDGCGLSSKNKISPRSLGLILDYAQKKEPRFYELFPTWKSTNPNVFIKAKSGTLSRIGVNAMAGYMILKDGDNYAFVILANRSPYPKLLYQGKLTQPILDFLPQCFN